MISQDLIKKCKEGYYLNDDKKGCTLFPDGINECINYESKGICL